uniref:Protein LTV1 homolog n=1 Tax=Odontella aurita TaxID=265563 RepID=A0A7S4HNA3_9STRA
MAFFQGAKDIRRGCPGDEDDVDDDEDSLDREFGGDDDDGHDDVANLHRVEATPGVVPALAPDEEKALADKFLQTLAEYDSDDVGDLDDHHDECRGDVMLEGDARLEATFDEFLTEKKDEIFVEGTSHLAEKRREGGSSYAALVGRTMVHVSQLGEAGPVGVADERPQDLRDVMAEADATLASPEMEPPAEEVLIDGKSYFSQASRNPWDCESILSTYSNLDNNPAMVGRSGRGRRRRKGGSGKKKGSKEFGAGMGPEGVPEDEPVKIVLSSKTGLPLSAFDKEGTGGNPDAAADHRFAPPREGGVHPEYCDDDGREYDEYGEDMDDTYLSVNLGEKRDKTESKMDKKARKVAVKEERRVARIQKKMMREAFGDEFARRSGANAEDDVAGKSVFRYS